MVLPSSSTNRSGKRSKPAGLDQASDHIVKTIALIEASEPGTQPEDPKFEKHRVQTLKRLCGAQEVLGKMRGIPFTPGEGDPCFEFTLQ